MQWFKTMTTNEYIRNMKEFKWKPISEKLWQRGFYDHIIRNENELWAIRRYIINNPKNWHK
jgi:REP element-mobilizing transposase RayT